jgi:hypothetical protein
MKHETAAQVAGDAERRAKRKAKRSTARAAKRVKRRVKKQARAAERKALDATKAKYKRQKWRARKVEQTALTFNVCCNNCMKKAAKDVKGLVKKVKAGNKKCPFSSKPAKKPVVVAFCCGSCVDKASS